MKDPRPALLARMKRLNLTYADLEVRTGIKGAAICRTLKGEPSITEQNLAKIAEAMARRK